MHPHALLERHCTYPSGRGTHPLRNPHFQEGHTSLSQRRGFAGTDVQFLWTHQDWVAEVSHLILRKPEGDVPTEGMRAQERSGRASSHGSLPGTDGPRATALCPCTLGPGPSGWSALGTPFPSLPRCGKARDEGLQPDSSGPEARAAKGCEC